MKIKHSEVRSVLILSIFFVFFSVTNLAQSVVVSSKKVTYKRPREKSDFRKTFTINYPQIKAANPFLSKKIENLLAYEKAFPFLNLKEQINSDNTLSEADFTVNYNKNGILDISLFCETIAAYPTTSTKNLIINSQTGARVRPLDVFTNLPQLAAMVRRAQQTEISQASAEYKRNAAENENFDGSEYFQSAKFTAVELNNFSVSDTGVTFNYDYEFPHVVLALEPDGRYFFDWSQLKPYISRNGLLAQFIR